MDDFHHLHKSLNLAAQTKTYLDGRKEWTWEDWLLLGATGLYAGVSIYKTCQDSKQLFDAVFAEKVVERKTTGIPVPARMHIRTAPTSRRAEVLKAVKKTSRPRIARKLVYEPK